MGKADYSRCEKCKSNKYTVRKLMLKDGCFACNVRCDECGNTVDIAKPKGKTLSFNNGLKGMR